MRTSKIPVLMYHALVKNHDALGINNIHVTTSEFEKQMTWLYEHGYTTISIAEMLRFIETSIPEKKIVLTFDDGYYSLLKHATPILQKYGFMATLFLTSATAGGKTYTILDKCEISYPPNDRPLSWSELVIMQNMGWDIQSHGARHLKHNTLSKAELYTEMNDCKLDIKNNLEKQSLYYSFPFGRYNTLCLKTLSELAFTAGFSVHQGLVNRRSDIRRLPRVEITRHDNLSTFIEKVSTGYATRYLKYKSNLIYQVYRNTHLKDFFKSFMDKINPN